MALHLKKKHMQQSKIENNKGFERRNVIFQKH